MELTPQSIRAVQFREKLRGYHPDDVDAFVAGVAEGVEQLEARVRQAESRAAEIETRQAGATDAEESLRRTLVLAQRTADAAIQEAREEAARVAAESVEQRAAAEAEVASLRQRLHEEADEERRTVRDQLLTERTALQADIEALRAHLERERERLRIYFTDQLRRVEEGEPGVGPSPTMEGADTTAATSQAAEPEPQVDERRDDDGLDVRSVEGPEGEEDPFLAELRRAVNDDKPLGPRDDEPGPAADGDGGDGFDLFVKRDEDEGRFGGRRRRRR